MLSFKQLQEKKTKIKLNPKKEDVMEGDKTLNHGEDCGCMKCDKKRRKDELGDEKSVSTEQKIYDSNEEVSEESTESNAQSDNSETNLLTFNQFHEGSSYGLYKGSGKPSGPMAAFAKPTKPNPKAKKQRVKNVGVGEETKYEVMSKEKYKNTHKDFKGGTKKEPRVSVYDPEKKATVSRLVKFSEAKYERGASNYGKMSIRNKRAVGYGGNAAPPEERRKAHDERMKKHKASQMKEEKHRDAALDAVKKSIIAQYGKGAIMRKGSNQQKKVRGAKSTAGTGKYKKMADQKKQTAADAKKRGFKSVQNYTDTMARYGGKDNYDKGRGLGS